VKLLLAKGPSLGRPYVDTLKGFSQPAISRIEGRTDIKLSTLIKYLTQMDLDMEIKVRPRSPKKGVPKEVLLFHT